MHWIFPRPKSEDDSPARLKKALDALWSKMSISYSIVDPIPFDRRLPEMPRCSMDEAIVIYGQTSFVTAAYESTWWANGVFFDPETFKTSAYAQGWGDLFLNSDAQIVRLRDLRIPEDIDLESKVFVKPNDDSKSFTGHETTWLGLKNMREGFLKTENPPEGEEGRLLSPKEATQLLDAEIVVASVKEISEEYRCFVAKTDSGELRYAFPPTGIPEELHDLVVEASRKWMPAKVFAIDVTMTADGPRIVEANCFNMSGIPWKDARPLVELIQCLE